MKQDKIWDYFQNEGVIHGGFSGARERFITKDLAVGQVVLDIGIGSGGVARLAFSKGVDIHALDPSDRAIERLRSELHIGNKAQIGTAQKIPFDDGIFDVVVMSEVLEHLNDSILTAALSEVRRVLVPSGIFLVTVPYREVLDAGMVICPDCGKTFHRWGHEQSFDRSKIKRVLNDNGYEIERIRITTFVDWRRKGFRQFIKSLLRLALARMGEGIADPHIVCLARKAG